MNSQQFVIWLKGFTEGVHEYNVTPKQWDLLKEKLAEVNDYPYSISVGTGGYGTLTTTTTGGVTYTSGTDGNWNIKNKDLLND
jgi:hypothetical protein